MAATFVASHQPTVTIPFDAPDYYAHGAAYAGLGFLLTRALAGGQLAAMTLRLALIATVLGTLYGVSDEFHQSFVPGRMATLSDVIADGVGALVGALVAAGVGRLLRNR
jgi:VanZ family protein